MTRQHWWIAAALALLLLVGIGVAAVVTYEPGNPAVSNTPTAQTAEPRDPATEGTTRVTISGTLTPLSTSNTPGFFLLRVVGEGYLPVQMGDLQADPGFGVTLTLEAPGEFVPAGDQAERFAQLREIATTTGEAFTVVEVGP